ncbi:hypothetical protein A9Y57_00139 [Streptococcus parauberis]|uniref:Uncharacterized protein n=1 Tax=Streptococcus parauberis TaxID=1348 RepID=A0A854WAR9_9STRE|nr:hypothetical protein [Streptococcus parauberis]PCH13871.1 hypothetical protein A9Y57_00505 [Streptococcus parauberis]PCH14137.1 hypothetical protein A9Y57_00139 [Streptococcus parauberis]
MVYKLFQVTNEKRIDKGTFEYLDQAMAEYHRVCRDEIVFQGWLAEDKIISENLIRIDTGNNSIWFEIEVTKDEPTE